MFLRSSASYLSSPTSSVFMFFLLITYSSFLGKKERRYLDSDDLAGGQIEGLVDTTERTLTQEFLKVIVL
jgi:hypothetical protein